MKFNLKNIPLVLIVGFNLFSLLLFYTAPYKWDTNNIYIFLIFALTCQSAIVIGYFIGFNRSNKTKARRHILSRLSDAKLNFIFLFYSLTFLILYAYKLKLDSFDIREMFNFLLIGVADPQLGYSLSIDESRTPPFSWTIYFLISIINNLFFVIGFLKWKDLSKFLKFLFVLFCLLELFFWIGRGTNFGVVSWVTTLSISSLFKLKNIRLNLRQKIKFSLIILILFLATVSSFSYIMYNRAGKKQIDIHYFDLVTSEVDKNGAMLKLLPESLHQTYLYIVAYLCQGYYHTSLAFDLPFKPTFFWGNNPVSVDISRLLGIDVWKQTYMYQLWDKGVDPLVKWHSAYLWYASDISFFGVPIVLFALGYFLGFSWSSGLKHNDFLSKIIFVIVGNMLLFLFANNTYLSSVFYSLIFIFPIWFFSRVFRIKIHPKKRQTNLSYET